MQLGYTMLCEQTAPKQLVSDLVRAKEIGLPFDGGYVNYAGQHITADSAKLYGLPAERVPVAIAASPRRAPTMTAAPLIR